MKFIIIILIILPIIVLIPYVLMKLGKLEDKDKDNIPDALEDAGKKVKDTTSRVGEEFSDVGKAFKEVFNQLGDIPKAFTGKKRSGRKKK